METMRALGLVGILMTLAGLSMFGYGYYIQTVEHHPEQVSRAWMVSAAACSVLGLIGFAAYRISKEFSKK